MNKFLKNAYLKTKSVAVGVKNFFNSSRLALGTFITFAASSASAALPANVEAKITEATDNVGLAGGLVLVVIITIMAFKWLRRAF